MNVTKSLQTVETSFRAARRWLLSAALFTAATHACLAMSHLTAISVSPAEPTTNAPGGAMFYTVTVTRIGEGMLNVILKADGLPAGATATFDTNSLRFTGREPLTLTTTLTITGNDLTPADLASLTVTGTARRETVTATVTPGTYEPAAPAAGPTLTLEALPDGAMQLRGLGVSGNTYQIEITADLAHPVWSPLASATADGNGRFLLTDTPAKDVNARFYRAVWTVPNN
ncbi:MAG TPA: hypothetical protein VFV96_04605 [Verrucomicrobiae bacterium]|nr:hypothetical protein [Verrucomicrobiae bacterium]